MIDYVAWLKDPAAVRIVLIEVGVKVAGLETTRYLSTGAYVTSPTDSPANTYYDPVVTTGLKFTEQLDLTGKGGLSAGDIEIVNYNGERDNWLNDIWDNRPIKAWLGDPRWIRADFQMIFNGVVATIGSKSRDVLNLSLRDKLQRLNTPITDAKIGGTGANKDEVISLSFGENHNVSPRLTNAVTLEYQVHDSAVEDIFEVRDNGKPITVAVNNATGRFTLPRASAGSITASVQGDKFGATYRTTIASLIQRIVKGYGQVDSRFVDADIDISNMAAFDTAAPQQVGIYADGRTNVLTLCQDLAASVGAQIVMSRLGLLRLIQLKVPGANTPVEVMPAQMVERSLKIASMPLVRSSVMLGFCKNWTQQPGLLTSIPDEHKALYESEWLTTTKTAVATQSDYKLNSAPSQEDTMLCTRNDAEIEAQRRLDLWKVQRTMFTFEGTSDLLQTLELGNAITLKNRRYGLSSGKTGIVVSLAPNWLNGHVTVGVLV
jgi:hypothetical protein